MQPPILHQYSPPPPPRASLKEAALFCIYFEDAIVCLLFIHRRRWGCVGAAARIALRNQVSPAQIGTRR